jgi:hypothetical protein
MRSNPPRRILDSGPLDMSSIDTTLAAMQARVIELPASRRDPRPARPPSSPPPGRRGRAWINGREVGGPDPRYRHLAGGHD